MPNLGEMREESSERSAIGQENRKMIEAEESTTWNRSGTAQLVEVNDLVILAVSAEAYGI